jgi:acetyltransferase-like isoleucine patch superfamily enzyme
MASPVSLLRTLVRLVRRVRFRLGGRSFTHVPGVMGLWPQLAGAGTMSLGRGVVFRGLRTPVRLEVARGGELDVGPDVFINDGVNIYAARRVTIGAHTKIADGAMVYDPDFHPVGPDQAIPVAPVSIGRNVWIGARAMVLAGAEVGDHAVIAAGAVVRGPVPARSVVAGSPARVIRTFDCADDWVRPPPPFRPRPCSS